ncbi:hypothetical protein F3J44_26925 [Pantoea sp. Tr-811]|nr:hypothetical protein [Pantoea sp. Ap-967]NIF29983.1 hypothetical protein [Pantoea sp. Tr-811]
MPHDQAENNKNCTKKQRLNWLDRLINVTSAAKAIRLLLTPGLGGRPQASRFVGRALNKNKKPSKKTIRARNDFLGSLGSPCRFSPSSRPSCQRLHHSLSKC